MPTDYDLAFKVKVTETSMSIYALHTYVYRHVTFGCHNFNTVLDMASIARDTHRHRHIHRQTDIQTDRHTHTYIYTRTFTHTHIHAHVYT